MTERILILGDVTSFTDHEATRIATNNNLENKGLITRDTDVSNLSPGVYHTTVYDCDSGKIVRMSTQFNEVILLDIPQKEWSHSKLLLSSYKIMKELESKEVTVSYRDNQNIKGISFFDDFLQTNKSFCLYPWVQYSSGADGLRLCTRDNRKVQDVDKMTNWKSDPEYTKIRQKMLNGEKMPEHCSTCYLYESRGTVSYRQHDSLDYIAQYEINSLDDLDKIEQPYQYDIWPSNKCNAMCRTCMPRLSNLIAREYKNNPSLYIGRGVMAGEEDKPYGDLGAVNIDYLTDNHSVYIAGGDASVMKDAYEFLEECISRGKTDFQFSFGSNGTHFSKRFKKILESMSNVQCSLSMDGYGTMNDYVRWLTKWENVVNNGKYLLDIGANVTIEHVPTIWGVHRTHELFEFLDTEFVGCPMYFQYNSVDLTSAFKSPLVELVVESMKRCMKTNVYYADGKSTKTGIETLHKHYQTYRPNMEHLQKFFDWNDTMDRARNIQMKDYIPELDECRNLLDKK